MFDLTTRNSFIERKSTTNNHHQENNSEVNLTDPAKACDGISRGSYGGMVFLSKHTVGFHSHRQRVELAVHTVARNEDSIAWGGKEHVTSGTLSHDWLLREFTRLRGSSLKNLFCSPCRYWGL